jgi:hypothetical protein
MGKRAYQWEVRKLKASPALFLGYVHAPDEKAARKATLKELRIKPAHEKSLLIRRT